jgi:hypothetical protein
VGKRVIAFGEKGKHTLEISWSDWNGVVSVKNDGKWKNDAPWRDLIPILNDRRSYDYAIRTNEVRSVHLESWMRRFHPVGNGCRGREGH